MAKTIVYALPMVFSTGGTEAVIVNLLNQFAKDGYESRILTTYNQNRPKGLPDNIIFDVVSSGDNNFEKRVEAIDDYFSQFDDGEVIFITFTVNQFTHFISSQNLILKSKSILFHWHFDHDFSLETFRLYKIKNYSKWIDKMIVLSDEIRDGFIQAGIPNVVSIANPLTYEEVVMPKEKSNKVIFVGRYAEIKQPDHLIKAVNLIKDKVRELNEKFTFHLYGPEDTYSIFDLNKLIKKYKISDLVNIEGPRKKEELKDIFQDAKLSIMTSYSEGEGLVLYEALVNSTPVISYDIVPIRDNIIQHNYNGKLVELNNIQELANSIYDCISNNKHLNELSKNSYEFAKKIVKLKNIRAISDKWYNVFEENYNSSKSIVNNENIDFITNYIVEDIKYPNVKILTKLNKNSEKVITCNKKFFNKAEFYLVDDIVRDLEKNPIYINKIINKENIKLDIPKCYENSSKLLVSINNNELNLITTSIGRLLNSTKMKKVTVVISLFGICDKLENCINSVIKQTIGMNEIDIILLDQGVDDESKRIIDYYREIYDNIRIISGATTLNEYKNKAIQIANSEYIMFLDQEDYYSISSINRLYEEAICRGINIIGGYNVNYTEKSKSRCWWYTKLELDKVYTTDDTEAISEYINLNNFIFRLDFIKNNHIEFSNNKYHNKCFMYNMIFENKEFCIIDCLVSYIFSEKYSQSMDSISIKDNIIANHEILELLFKNGKEQFICELMANRILYRTFNTFIKWDEDRKLMESVALEIKKLCLLIRQRTLTLGLKPKLSIDVNRVYYDLLAGNIVEAMRKMWYYFKAKQAFQMKVYDVFEEGEYVVIKAIYPFSMLYRNDINFIKNLKVVLYDKESKAESELEFNFGDYTYYKYDYPNEKFLNPLDNLIIKIPLPQFQEGKYSLRFRMLNSLGEFYYSNLGVLRKMGRFKIIENDKIKMLDFKILDKKFEIEIKEIQNTLSEKARSLYGNLLDDIKILKQFPDNPWQLVKLRVSHELGLNKLKKPTVLIGELPNTYQDSGAIFFEYLKSKNVNFNYYYITDKEELLKKDKRCIAFGSNKHRELFITSDVVMNVQNIDDWMNPFFLRNEKYVPKRRKEDKNVFIGMKDVMKKQKRIFMQHGVLYHSGLTNSIFFNADFDALIVSTEFEKSVFPRDAREFIPSILPRYNTYSRENNKQYKKIFFSLTWRNYLKDFRSGGVKEDELLSSLYFNSIIDFVTNVRLSDMMNKYNTEILINIHHTMKEFIVEKLEELNLSKNIKICTGEESINDLIKECDICITDYSSLFFDFIYQNKPVIHYLFDYEDYYTREDNNKRQNDFFKIKDYKGCMHTENVEQLLGTLEEVLSGKKTVDYDIEFFNNDNPCEELLTVINTYIKGGDHENYTYERSVKDIYTT